MATLLSTLEPDLTAADQKAVWDLMHAVELAPGDDVATKVGSSRALCVVASGEIAALLPTKKGDLELRELTGGDFFGETEFIDGGEPLAKLTVRTPAAVYAFTPEDYDQLVQNNTSAASRLALCIGRRLASRVRASSIVKFENIDDDPEVEVVSGMSALLSSDTRPGAPMRCLSMSAHAGSGMEGKTADQQRHEIHLVAKMLQPLGHELYYGIGERMMVRTFDAGAPIVTQGDVPDGMYLLLDGGVDVQVTAAEGVGHETTLRPGSVFGQISFLLDAPRSATCKVSERATIGIVGAHTVQGLIRYAKEGRRAGVAGMEWIAKQCAQDLRRVAEALAAAYEAA